MIVIGGDRHLMSFNDIYIFNLNEIKLWLLSINQSLHSLF
jgi:hypothetical protein